MQVNLTWTTPATRSDGSPLTVGEIQQTRVSRNGTVIATPTAVDGVMTLTDSGPIAGANVYDVTTVTTDGQVSAPSNSVSVTVTAAASAVTDLAATLVP